MAATLAASAFIIFILLSGPTHTATIQCPDALCVAVVYAQLKESPAVVRFRVWRADDFARHETGNELVWAPIIDEQYQ